MTTKKKTPLSALQEPPHHRVDALLHSMRCITQYEDALCELSHELKKSRVLSEETSEELRDLLEKIPSHNFLMDLESLKATLPVSAPPSRPERSVKAVRSSSTVKKKSGGKSSK